MSKPDDPVAPPAIDGVLLRRVVRWLPFAMAGHLLVGVPALLISLVVAWGTFVQARATQRMQQAGAWPFVAYGTSNYSAEGKHRINLTLINNGVGPAVLGPVELRYRGRAMRTAEEVLTACCGYSKGQPLQLATVPASDVSLRPGEAIAFLELADVPANARWLPRLEAERWKLKVRSCYCSIFEECWTITGIQTRPVAVAQCPADWIPYQER